MTATVTLCGCGHAERVHERDSATEHGRGMCMAGRTCTCSEFRPSDRVTTPPVVATPPIAAPAERREEPSHDTVQAKPYACTECPNTFGTPQALGAHRRYSHPKTTRTTTELPDGAKEGARAEQPARPAAVTPDAPPVRATESGTPPAGGGGGEQGSEPPPPRTPDITSTPPSSASPAVLDGWLFDITGNCALGIGPVQITGRHLTYEQVMHLLFTIQPLAREETP